MKKNIKDNSLELRFKPKLYPLEAIYKACYVFVDRAYLFLDGNPKKEIKILMKGKENLSKKQLESLAGEFSNELLAATLRINLGKENKKTREYIIAQALFSSLGQDNFESAPKYVAENDPLGIAIPWEEKYGRATDKLKTVGKSKKKSRK